MLLVAICGVAASQVPEAYRAMKVWRARGFLAKAEGFSRVQKWQEAFSRIQAAYQLAPQDPAIIRFAARIYTVARHSQALQFWQQLLEGGEATEADLEAMADLALASGNWQSAKPIAAHWFAKPPRGHSNRLILMARYFQSAQELGVARQFAAWAVEARPDDPIAQLFLAKLQMADPGAELTESGLASFWKLVDDDTLAGLEALNVLARRPNLPPENMKRLVARLRLHPMRRLSEELLAKDLSLKLEPESFFREVDTTTEQFKQSPPEHRLAVGRWLNRHKSFQRTLDLFPLDEALKTKDAFALRLDALAAMDRWRQVGEELDQEPNPLEAVFREVFRARVAKELGDTPGSEAAWRRVHLQAGTSPQSLRFVAQYAERVGARADAIQAYRRLASMPGQAREAYVDLIRIANTDHDTRFLRDIMIELHRLYPDDPMADNDLAFLNLLMKENMEESKATALRLVDQYPQRLAYRTTAALGHLRANEIAKAKKVYEGLALDWGVLNPGMQAVHAAVHGASGNASAAREFAQQIPIDKLKPEERELIEKWLQ